MNTDTGKLSLAGLTFVENSCVLEGAAEAVAEWAGFGHLFNPSRQ